MRTIGIQFSESAINLLDDIEREIRSIIYNEASEMVRREHQAVVSSDHLLKALTKVIEALRQRQKSLFGMGVHSRDLAFDIARHLVESNSPVTIDMPSDGEIKRETETVGRYA